MIIIILLLTGYVKARNGRDINTSTGTGKHLGFSCNGLASHVNAISLVVPDVIGKFFLVDDMSVLFLCSSQQSQSNLV